jgi:DNA-binding NtrC family response regulator
MAHCSTLVHSALDSFPEIDGRSPAIRTLKHHMARVGRDPDVTVLILGESGTGKERVASAIHRVSPRQGAPFVVINCAGLSSTLIEDELFGHVRGAFTSATSDRVGPFERASGGTVFLDEIAELSVDLQTKLLRALQQRTVQRLGGRDEIRFDARIVAATNIDLAAAVARGNFRSDLYYRLKVYDIRVPPLRERGLEDVRALVRAILTRLAASRRRPAPALHPDVLERFGRYHWPGNVRELENTLERMIVAAGEAVLLTSTDLPDDFGLAPEGSAPERASPSRLGRARPQLPSPEAARLALQRHDFKRAPTARELGLSRHQLYRLLRATAPDSGGT